MPRETNIIELDPILDGKDLRIGLVMSRFNQHICEGLLSACASELERLGVAKDSTLLATVPGALEIPITLRKMAASQRFDALIALGAVVRGDTYHFEVVSNEMAAGISRVMLDADVPIANGVLTTDNDDQALKRMSIKGREAAQCAIEMANLLKRI
jgi:6,7-dimethyl-8-ribityllumazine synthase